VPVTALLELQLKPDSLDTAHDVIHDTLAATRAFPGCVAALVMVDSQDPAHVVVVETWESLGHDRAYREWRATPEGASSLGTVLAAPPRLTVLTLAEGV
jgi:heme oxygenase (mycobilin-producing)